MATMCVYVERIKPYSPEEMAQQRKFAQEREACVNAPYVGPWYVRGSAGGSWVGVFDSTNRSLITFSGAHAWTEAQGLCNKLNR